MMNRSLAILLVLFASRAFAWGGFLDISEPVPIIAEDGTKSFFDVAHSLRSMRDDLTGEYESFNQLGTLAAWSLRQQLQNHDAVVRRRVPLALVSLISMRKDFAPELKVLTEALLHKDAEVRKNAAFGMAWVASKAAFCSGALQSALSDTDADVRLGAAAALFNSGTATEETVVAMQAPFATASTRFRYLALNALIQSDYCMLANVALPVLRAALQDVVIAHVALGGYEKLGPLARGSVSEIELQLKSVSPTDRYMAVRALRSIRQDQPDLAFFSKRALLALLRGDPRKYSPFISERLEQTEDLALTVQTEKVRGKDRVRDSSFEDMVGTADYAVMTRRGFSMEFIRENGAWKLLHINMRMC